LKDSQESSPQTGTQNQNQDAIIDSLNQKISQLEKDIEVF